MRRIKALVAVAAIFALSGCSLRGRPAAKSTPPPPQPVITAPAPTQPPAPLSVPQTQVRLPAPQPVSPEALATVIDLPGRTEAAPKTQRRIPTPPVSSGSAVPKPENTPAGIGPQPVEPERPRIQEIVPAPEQKRLADSVEARKHEIRARLDQAQGRQLSAHERTLVSRIQSFVKLSDDAAARGDLRQADALAERAQILSRELLGGR